VIDPACIQSTINAPLIPEGVCAHLPPPTSVSPIQIERETLNKLEREMEGRRRRRVERGRGR
jgi:hypothetical protein